MHCKCASLNQGMDVTQLWSETLCMLQAICKVRLLAIMTSMLSEQRYVLYS
jgi:hypothetical protein